MAWPLASHFSAMLQNPRHAFRDPVLQQSVVEKNARGQPRPWAGAFAVVYKATVPQAPDPFALRVFTTESPERRERYDHISAYLSKRRLDCLCAFEYRDSAIRSAGDGKWYPLILMEWVEGHTLFEWARARSLAGDSRALADAADTWLRVAEELADAAVAHGDLQHANILVSERGQLKLVDYDCLCVPALVGRRNLELGVEPYQHPARNGNTPLSFHLDRFSELVIYTALRALAAAPDLWEKHVEATSYDKLLFRAADLRASASSALCRDLQGLSDAGVRQLTDCLCDLAHAPMDQIPPLSQIAYSCAKSPARGNDGKTARVAPSGWAHRKAHGREPSPATHPLPIPGRPQLDENRELPVVGGSLRPPLGFRSAANGPTGGSRPTQAGTPPGAGGKAGSRTAPPPLRPGRGKKDSRPAPPPLGRANPKGGSRPAPPPRLPWIDANAPAAGTDRMPLANIEESQVPPTFLDMVWSQMPRSPVIWVCLAVGMFGFAILIALLALRGH